MGRSPEEKHTDLISATLECVDAQGVHAVRLRDVADRSGLSKAWILSVYPTRSALVARVVGDRFAERVENSINLMALVVDRFATSDAFIDAVGTSRGQGDHVLEREEVWQFLEVLVWSNTDARVAGELADAKRRLVESFERLTARLDDRQWFHADVGPISAAILLMASSLARVFTKSDIGSRSGEGEESLFLLTLNALLCRRKRGSTAPVRSRGEERQVGQRPTVGQNCSEEVHRERVLVAASQELADRGPLDFRIQAVMDRAQVSTTMIYKMFATRDELVEHAAVRLAADNKAVARAVLIDAASASRPAGCGSEREQAVAALQSIFEHVRSSERHRVLLGLTSLVSGRRIDSEEQFARRKHEHFGAAAQVFAAQLNVLGDLDVEDYVEVGPLGFFMMVVLVNFPDGLGADVDLAPAFLRVVDSTIQLPWSSVPVRDRSRRADDRVRIPPDSRR